MNIVTWSETIIPGKQCRDIQISVATFCTEVGQFRVITADVLLLTIIVILLMYTRREDG
jgi:hypothetical protein